MARHIFVRLVKVHPETGRKSLFIGRHAFGIPGMVRDEQQRATQAQLLEHVSDEGTRVYQHRWRVGDLLVWDNRCLLHRARPYDYSQEPRVLIGSRVAGEVDSELAYYPEDDAAGREAHRSGCGVKLSAQPFGPRTLFN